RTIVGGVRRWRARAWRCTLRSLADSGKWTWDLRPERDAGQQLGSRMSNSSRMENVRLVFIIDDSRVDDQGPYPDHNAEIGVLRLQRLGDFIHLGLQFVYLILRRALIAGSLLPTGL